MESINGFGKLTLSQIKNIETSLHIELPPDYKQFLLDFNGGIPKDNYLTLTVENLDKKPILGVLFGINEDSNFDLIDWNSEYKSDMPKSTIIIGADYSSGLFVMMDNEYNGIYYWDNSKDGNNVYFIAPNFINFMKLWKLESYKIVQ